MRFFTFLKAGLASIAPILVVVELISSVFIMPISMDASPSVSFNTTLPVKPSATTTSAAPEGISRGSILPVKLRPLFSSSG